MKKLFYLFICATILMSSTACGCSKKEETNQTKTEDKKTVTTETDTKTEEIEELKEVTYDDLAGTYFSTGKTTEFVEYDNYITLNSDGTFFKQSSYCTGISHTKGTYKFDATSEQIKLDFYVEGHNDIAVSTTLRGVNLTLRYKQSDVEDVYAPIKSFFDFCLGGYESNGYEVHKFVKGKEESIYYEEAGDY